MHINFILLFKNTYLNKSLDFNMMTLLNYQIISYINKFKIYKKYINNLKTGLIFKNIYFVCIFETHKVLKFHC